MEDWELQTLILNFYLLGKPFSLFFHVLKPFHMLSEVHLSPPEAKYTSYDSAWIDLPTRFRAKIFKPEEGPSRDLPKHCKISRRIVYSSTLWSWNAHLTRSCSSNGYFILWFGRFPLKSVWCCIELHCNDTERKMLQTTIKVTENTHSSFLLKTLPAHNAFGFSHRFFSLQNSLFGDLYRKVKY